jgi:hypothetical protein
MSAQEKTSMDSLMRISLTALSLSFSCVALSGCGGTGGSDSNRELTSGIAGTARYYISETATPPEVGGTVILKNMPPDRFGPEPEEITRTSTDAQGKFTFTVEPGDYIVEVTGHRADNGIDYWGGTGVSVYAGRYTQLDLLLSAGGLPGAVGH